MCNIQSYCVGGTLIHLLNPPTTLTTKIISKKVLGGLRQGSWWTTNMYRIFHVEGASHVQSPPWDTVTPRNGSVLPSGTIIIIGASMQNPYTGA